jgi:Na+/melibiose symporter-like transporter
MPISFNEIGKGERQKYLIYLLMMLVLFTGLFYLRNFFIKEEVSVEEPVSTTKKIKIDFEFLETKKELFDDLQTFEEIKPVEGIEIGRENPFISY